MGHLLVSLALAFMPLGGVAHAAPAGDAAPMTGAAESAETQPAPVEPRTDTAQSDRDDAFEDDEFGDDEFGDDEPGDDEFGPGPDGTDTVDEPEPERPANVSGDVEARESVYFDSDATVVSTTSVDLTFSPGDTGLTFRGGYVADVVSSASVDVVSAATKKFTELRSQGTGGLALERGLWVGSVGYTFSDENDWTSHTGSIGLGRDFAERTTNISAGYIFVDNSVFRAGDANFSDSMRTHAANLTLTQVLTKRTTSRLSAFYGYNRGYQSSPYRFVPVGTLPGQPPSLATCQDAVSCPLERHPRLRSRAALAATLLHYVGRQRPGSIRFAYRLYGDSWEVLSHAATVAYTADLAKRWQVRVRSRTYFQDSAFFYRERYPEALRYLTTDRELSTFIHQLTGAKLTFKTGLLGQRVDDLRIDVKADMGYFHFFNFVRLPYRLAGIVELGARIVF